MIYGVGDYLKLKQFSLALDVSTKTLKKANNLVKNQLQGLLKALPNPKKGNNIDRLI